MSAVLISEHLDKLIKLHSKLSELADEKTEAIKTSSIEKVEKVMIEEQKYIQAISQVETQRQKAVEAWLGTDGNSPSLLDCIDAAESGMKEKLSGQRGELLLLTNRLKEQNQLNQQLIYHSLQFVNLSLDLMKPQRSSGYNYEKPAGAKAKPSPDRGLFDSKA